MTYVRGWWSPPRTWCAEGKTGLRTVCGVRIHSHTDREKISKSDQGGSPARIADEMKRFDLLCEACKAAMK